MKIETLTPYWPWLPGLLIGASLGAALGYFGQCTSGTCPLTSTWWRGAIYGGVIGLLFALSSSSRARGAESERSLLKEAPPTEPSITMKE